MTDEKILALDYGEARIGVAISFGSLAEPLRVLPNDAQTFPILKQILEHEGVTRIVVGMSEQEMAEKSSAFGFDIQQRFGIPVEFEDETLSSAEVQKLLAEKNRGRRQYRGHIDHLAAARILQNYLDRRGF